MNNVNDILEDKDGLVNIKNLVVVFQIDQKGRVLREIISSVGNSIEASDQVDGTVKDFGFIKNTTVVKVGVVVVNFIYEILLETIYKKLVENSLTLINSVYANIIRKVINEEVVLYPVSYDVYFKEVFMKVYRDYKILMKD